MTELSAVEVHSMDEAIAALRAGVRAGTAVRLVSAPGAALSAGAGWWAALVVGVRQAVPEARFSAVLDCGDATGLAMAALQQGVDGIAVSAAGSAADTLASIAAQRGLTISINRPEA